MNNAMKRSGFWLALGLAVVLGVGTIVLAATDVEASEASGAITIQCGTALVPKPGAEVDVPSINAQGAFIRHPCDGAIRRRRVLFGVLLLGTVTGLIWLGYETGRVEDDELLTV